jgi:hypothetical protein
MSEINCKRELVEEVNRNIDEACLSGERRIYRLAS